MVGCFADKIAGLKLVRAKAVHGWELRVRDCCKLRVHVAVAYFQPIWNDSASVVWMVSQNREVQQRKVADGVHCRSRAVKTGRFLGWTEVASF